MTMSRPAALAIIALVTIGMVACSVDQVLADINVLIQVAGSIGAAIGNTVSPAEGAEIQKLSGIASDGMAAVEAAYKTYKASGATTDLQKVQAVISAVQSNLQQELAAAHIVNPVAQQKVTNWVNLISSTLAAVLTALPQLQAKKAGTKEARVAMGITSQTLKARWASEVCAGDKACAALVK